MLLSVGLAGLSLSNYTDFGPGKPQAKEEHKLPTIRLLPKPNDLLLLALEDSKTIPEYSRPFIRYLSVQDSSIVARKVASLACAYINRAPGIYRPEVLYDGKLLRVDLRWLAKNDSDLRDLLVVWEEFQFDPIYALLITKGTLGFLTHETRKGLPKKVSKKLSTRTVTVKEASWREEKKTIHHNGGRLVWPDDSGRSQENVSPGDWSLVLRFKVPAITKTESFLETVELSVEDLDDVDVIRFNAPHLNQQAIVDLQLLLNTQAPIVDWHYFLSRSLTSIKDDGLYKEVFGGLYYDLRGIKKAKTVLGKDTKATDLDLFFETMGIGNIKAGVTADKLFDTLRSDQRMVMYKSNITGNVREMTSFHTPNDQEGAAWGGITGDIERKRIDITDRQYANLLNRNFQAREALFPGPSSFIIAGLFDGNGNLLEKAADNVVHDSTVPEPFHTELQSIISCLRCHGAKEKGTDMWWPFESGIAKILKGRKIDIFDDLQGNPSFLNHDTISRIVGLYRGNFKKNLQRARDDAAEATLRATGPWDDNDLKVLNIKAELDQRDVVWVAHNALQQEYANYNYTLVTPRLALKRLGFEVGEKDAVTVFNALLPPDNRAEFGGIILEDPRLAPLREGIGILPADFLLFYSFLQERVQKTLATASLQDKTGMEVIKP